MPTTTATRIDPQNVTKDKVDIQNVKKDTTNVPPKVIENVTNNNKQTNTKSELVANNQQGPSQELRGPPSQAGNRTSLYNTDL